MMKLKYYDLGTIKEPERVKDILREATATLTHNALTLNFHKDEVREDYIEQVKLVQNYLTVMEIMLEDG